MSQAVYIFTGPTIQPREVRAETGLEAIFLPPVKQGDVYRIVSSQPQPLVIGIIDGYFDHVPAVWHKEILWAIKCGIPVFGSASMGALRAAELEAFGMVGVGKIFEGYRDGLLEDDSEVALVHGPADAGYLAMSEPLVNIRATFAKACMHGVISNHSQQVLIETARQLFYPERLYPNILQRAAGAVPASEIQALKSWLKENRVNQKRLDALQMLGLIKLGVAGELDLTTMLNAPGFTLEETEVWQELKRIVKSKRTGGPVVTGEEEAEEADKKETAFNPVLEELRLEGLEKYLQVHNGAMARSLALDIAQNFEITVNDEILYRFVVQFRKERGLLTPEQLAEWMAVNDLDENRFLDLLRDEVLVRLVQSRHSARIPEGMTAYLQVLGDYRNLAEKAAAKDTLEENLEENLEDILVAQIQPMANQRSELPDAFDKLLCWYFIERLNQPELLDVDLQHYIELVGFRNLEDFKQALVRDFHFQSSAHNFL